MSVGTKAIGLAKTLKHRFQDGLRARTPVYLSPVRRIERVALDRQVCAMTFDDGPCRLPARPSGDDTPLTLRLAETLERWDARGTFDVVGDTSENYPDRTGKEGTAQWGGVRFDHYPDFGRDAEGGVRNCPELTRRLLAGGHEITSHTYRHVLFGPKPLVYAGRDPLPGLDAVVEDLRRLDRLMREDYGYEIRLSRPPHYVDKTRDGFSSYDAYGLMGYQYLAASFDGAGWLPGPSYEAEVEAMVRPMEQRLGEDPDFFRGQIIFQKDGYNMARRSPVADGLDRQLRLLTERGYRVVTVSELLALCPFADVSPAHPVFEPAKTLLSRGFCVCFRDNTVKPDGLLTRGELAMYRYGCGTVARRVALVRGKKPVCRDVSCRHPYAAAIAAALEDGMALREGGCFRPDAPVSGAEFAAFCRLTLGATAEPLPEPITRGAALSALAALLPNP